MTMYAMTRLYRAMTIRADNDWANVFFLMIPGGQMSPDHWRGRGFLMIWLKEAYDRDMCEMTKAEE